MISRARDWYRKRQSPGRTAIRAIFTGVGAYATAFLGIAVSESVGGGRSWVLISLLLLSLLLFIIVSIFISNFVSEFEGQETQRKQVIRNAYFRTDDCVTAETKAVRAASTLEKQNNYVFVPCDPLDAVRVLVKSLYEVMSSAYSGEWVDEKINFEVTFMTRSYLDQGITIAAWANSDGQSPRSLLARRSNPKLYDSTVTAELYRDEEIGRASPRIIEDTADPVYRYQAVYPNQKERIKSSIIWPILSDETRLLGTLVVHCDKPNFFLQKDERYWSQILSVFARRIALEKLRLDMSIYVHTDADRKIVSGEPVHLF